MLNSQHLGNIFFNSHVLLHVPVVDELADFLFFKVISCAGINILLCVSRLAWPIISLGKNPRNRMTNSKGYNLLTHSGRFHLDF